ncbi:uncharacterized protein PHALS_15392 [Plasmopara halstedii]|uniref:Uncharacterized protein n=1 Tax=Plasmopara halstedii TaxID=4781 RepID=A0A0P1AGG9_PLAHL|nr:uncharacterized protein PHALS_15392 [Plasmopara halstedii]CEG39560.1 hypothetical protein PHALS_15392 [Plasmopara halstedii]|eukprot:XP_024575929.1 hypothetical protein PHALS_15392 [Plasmopara halstedii]
MTLGTQVSIFSYFDPSRVFSTTGVRFTNAHELRREAIVCTRRHGNRYRQILHTCKPLAACPCQFSAPTIRNSQIIHHRLSWYSTFRLQSVM